MDPEIIALTVGIPGWPLALSRLAASLVLSLGAGYLTLLLTRLGYCRRSLPGEETSPTKASVCCSASAIRPAVSVRPAPTPLVRSVAGPTFAGLTRSLKGVDNLCPPTV